METGNRDKQSQGAFLCTGSISCSVCLEVVSDRGERSIAKLKCGHHFHLDCIGSAFNAKGAMQCPNCRHVEHGQWLYANGCRPYEEFTVEDLPNDDYLYDLHHTEMPLGFPWCPYQSSFSQLSVSLEDTEPPSGAYPDLIVNVLYGEHPSASNGAHVCPYLAVHGLTRARQMPISLSNAGSSNSAGDIGPHHRNAAPAVGEAFSSHAFPASETHHRHWHSSNTFPSNNSVPSADDPALPALPSHDRFGIPRTESDRLHRTGSPMPSGYGANGFYPRAVNARPPPPMTSEFVHSQNHIHGHVGGQIYHPPSTSSIHSGLISHNRRSRSRETLVPSRRVIQNIPAEQARMQGASAYPMSRGQEGDNMGWHQNNHFYGLQMEGFPPAPWVPLDHDSQRWAWFHRGQNPQNVPSEPLNRNYYRHSYFSAEGVAQGRPGISLETPYQRHGYTRFPPSFP